MQETENINLQDLGMSMIDIGRYEHVTRVTDVSTTISQVMASFTDLKKIILKNKNIKKNKNTNNYLFVMQSEHIEGEDIGEAEVYNDDGVCNQDIFENMQLEEVI